MNIPAKKYLVLGILITFLIIIVTPVVAINSYGSFTDLTSSGNGAFTVKSTENGTIWLFEAGKTSPIWSYNLHGETLSAAISPDNKYVAVGSGGGLIWLFDEKGIVVWNKTFGNAGIKSIVFSKDSLYIDASSFMNQAFYISIQGNPATRPALATITAVTSVTPAVTPAQIPTNLDLSWIESFFRNNLNLLAGIVIGLILAGIAWRVISHRENREIALFKSIRDILTLKNFTLFSLVLIGIGGALVLYYPAQHGEISTNIIICGIAGLAIAYYLCAMIFWGTDGQLFATFMLAIPLSIWYFSTNKITGSQNPILNILLVIAGYAFISAIVLFISDKIRKSAMKYIVRNRRVRYQGYPPDSTYPLLGIVVISLIMMGIGSSVILSENINTVIHSFPTSNANSPEPVYPTQNYVIQTAPYSRYTQPYVVQTTSVPTLSIQYTTSDDSKKYLDYINTIRVRNGVNTLQFDQRVYRIALARVNDMDKYGYLDHTNPETGTCPDSIKSQYGLGRYEYVAENAYGFASSTGVNYHQGIENDAINSWMTSRGHRYNLLYPHTGGAIVCSKGGHCVFLGLNGDRFGEGCYTAAQGKALWNSVGKQPNEI